MSKLGDADQVARFWQKVAISTPDDCWNWTASRCGDYGQLGVDGSICYAHRVSWCLAHNRQMADARVIRHSCDNPLCVNPRHLFDGTQADNLKDCSDKARIGHGERHYKAKLTDEQVREIRLRRTGRERAVDLAAEYGISRSQVLRIANGTSRQRYISDLGAP